MRSGEMPTMEEKLAPLFSPIKLPGGLEIRNRVVMLAMTRTRALADGTPSDMMVEYFSQRASEAGLLFTDSTAVSETGRGFINGPGMYTTEHALGWRRVVDAVHKKGAKIFLQINHVGRCCNMQHLRVPHSPVAPSAVRIPRTSRKISINIPRVTPYDVPREIETDEIQMIVDEYVRATRLARFAGFDGVQVHADSGYLIHQFLSTNVNQRTDRYGGSPENRARFALEVLDAVIAVSGPEYVAIKLTPGFEVHDIEETDIPEKYTYIIDELNKRKGLSFLHFYFMDLATSQVFSKLRERYEGNVLAEGSLSAEAYSEMIASGGIQLTGFARSFIANPDLLYRLRKELPLSQTDPERIYSLGERGYTDYPAWNPEDPEGSVLTFDDPQIVHVFQKNND